MDGKIHVESELGEGARFIFTVKATRGKQHLLSLLSPGVNPEDLNILVVDDDSFIREFFSNIFNHIGFKYDVAGSGNEALRMVKKNGNYDLYFIDWYMSDMDGCELTKHIKSPEFNSESIVTIISSDWEVVKDKAFEAGADKCMIKPLFASAIVERINECLDVKIAKQEEIFAEKTQGRFCGKRLLLAEDIEINREIVMALLDDTGLIIDEAENGRTAYEKVKSDPGAYDLIFMDIQMPKMDGLQATRQIRALPDKRAKTLPIVAMTANVFKDDIERCLEAGMDSHIGKPLDINEVLTVMERFL